MLIRISVLSLTVHSMDLVMLLFEDGVVMVLSFLFCLAVNSIK